MAVTYNPHNNRSLDYDDPGTMSDVELSSFQRGGYARASLPIVRSASSSLERPIGNSINSVHALSNLFFPPISYVKIHRSTNLNKICKCPGHTALSFFTFEVTGVEQFQQLFQSLFCSWPLLGKKHVVHQNPQMLQFYLHCFQKFVPSGHCCLAKVCCTLKSTVASVLRSLLS